MSTANDIARNKRAPFARCALTVLLFCVLLPRPSDAAGIELRNFGVRTRVGDKTVLGKDQLISFQEHDLFATVRLPWQVPQSSRWHMETRLLASAGVMQAAGKTALVASAIPVLAFSSAGGFFTLDLGAGLAFLSKHQFDIQDYGGPLQAALTLGVGIRLYHRIGIGYRFLHYSDAGAYGPDTLGADFHMVELIYRY